MSRLVLAIVAASLLAGCLTSNNGPTPTPTVTPTSPTTISGGSTSNGAGTVTVVTTKGTFAFALDPQFAPKTTAHVASLVQKGFYNGIPFHRYEPNFVIQGGDPNCKTKGVDDPSCGTGGSGSNVPLEVTAAATHVQGAIGLARSSAKDSGDSQWYVVLPKDGAHFLDGNYCVFGHVTTGMDVVQQLRKGDVMTKVTLS